jgi:hypothetical protein
MFACRLHHSFFGLVEVLALQVRALIYHDAPVRLTDIQSIFDLLDGSNVQKYPAVILNSRHMLTFLWYILLLGFACRAHHTWSKTSPAQVPAQCLCRPSSLQVMSSVLDVRLPGTGQGLGLSELNAPK